MESSLEKLNRQEDKYAAELEAALAQYDELRHRAADMDTMALDAVRKAIRPGKEHEAAQRLKTAYQKKFDSKLSTKSRKEVARSLDEPVKEAVSVRETLRRSYTQQRKQPQTKERSQER